MSIHSANTSAVVKPPKLVTASIAVASRSGFSIRRLVQSDIASSVVPRAGVLVCTEGSPGEIQAALRPSGVFTDEESSAKLLEKWLLAF